MVNEKVALCERIKNSQKVIPLGNGTKNALAASDCNNVDCLECTQLSGIVDYVPSEFLITAWGGTSMLSLLEALQQHAQYMPFDPLFVREGATLGGTIASGISGPQRMLHGGLRDFVMEVELIDGEGSLVRGGGKVVKNAAGFDLPKLMVGSYGRLGVITEATLKVLPAPAAYVSVSKNFDNFASCVVASQRLLSQPLPISAVDIDPAANLWIQFAGLEQSMAKVVERAEKLLDCRLAVQQEPYRLQSNLVVQNEQFIIRAATSAHHVASLAEQLVSIDDLELLCIAAAGATTWIKAHGSDALQCLDQLLRQSDLSGIVVRGQVSELRLLGNLAWSSTADSIRKAMDPSDRFLAYTPVR